MNNEYVAVKKETLESVIDFVSTLYDCIDFGSKEVQEHEIDNGWEDFIQPIVDIVHGSTNEVNVMHSLDEHIKRAVNQGDTPRYCVKDITLLSADEYEKYSSLIPFYFWEGANEFWLRSAGIEQNCVMGVTDDGFINQQGFDVTEELGVRPALNIKLLGSDVERLQQGSSIGLLEHMWTVLKTDGENTLVLCNSCIAQSRFDVNTNDFSNSHIKDVLGSWLQAQTQKDNDVVLLNANKFVDRER